MVDKIDEITDPSKLVAMQAKKLAESIDKLPESDAKKVIKTAWRDAEEAIAKLRYNLDQETREKRLQEIHTILEDKIKEQAKFAKETDKKALNDIQAKSIALREARAKFLKEKVAADQLSAYHAMNALTKAEKSAGFSIENQGDPPPFTPEKFAELVQALQKEEPAIRYEPRGGENKKGCITASDKTEKSAQKTVALAGGLGWKNISIKGGEQKQRIAAAKESLTIEGMVATIAPAKDEKGKELVALTKEDHQWNALLATKQAVLEKRALFQDKHLHSELTDVYLAANPNHKQLLFSALRPEHVKDISNSFTKAYEKEPDPNKKNQRNADLNDFCHEYATFIQQQQKSPLVQESSNLPTRIQQGLAIEFARRNLPYEPFFKMAPEEKTATVTEAAKQDVATDAFKPMLMELETSKLIGTLNEPDLKDSARSLITEGIARKLASNNGFNDSENKSALASLKDDQQVAIFANLLKLPLPQQKAVLDSLSPSLKAENKVQTDQDKQLYDNFVKELNKNTKSKAESVKKLLEISDTPQLLSLWSKCDKKDTNALYQQIGSQLLSRYRTGEKVFDNEANCNAFYNLGNTDTGKELQAEIFLNLSDKGQQEALLNEVGNSGLDSSEKEALLKNIQEKIQKKSKEIKTDETKETKLSWISRNFFNSNNPTSKEALKKASERIDKKLTELPTKEDQQVAPLSPSI